MIFHCGGSASEEAKWRAIQSLFWRFICTTVDVCCISGDLKGKLKYGRLFAIKAPVRCTRSVGAALGVGKSDCKLLGRLGIGTASSRCIKKKQATKRSHRHGHHASFMVADTI